jgi:hypothetical protein
MKAALPITGMKIPQTDRGRGAVSNLSKHEFGLLLSLILHSSYNQIALILNGSSHQCPPVAATQSRGRGAWSVKGDMLRYDLSDLWSAMRLLLVS